MSEKLYVITLTNEQRARLRVLCVNEAKRLGYGSKYWDDSGSTTSQPGGRREWPPQLKKLSAISRKLMP